MIDTEGEVNDRLNYIASIILSDMLSNGKTHLVVKTRVEDFYFRFQEIWNYHLLMLATGPDHFGHRELIYKILGSDITRQPIIEEKNYHVDLDLLITPDGKPIAKNLETFLQGSDKYR